mgnify:CR=1 FL=1
MTGTIASSSNQDLSHQWALVTGASSGFGIDFSDILAKRGCNLVLVARSEDKLKQQQQKLESEYQIKTHVIVMDLAQQQAGKSLFDAIDAAGITINICINNAGFAVFGKYIDANWEDLVQMFNVDMITLADLTWRFAKRMKAQGGGHILNVASFSGYQPIPMYAGYASAKAFVLNLSEAINMEMRQDGVNVCALAPGFTRTNFLKTAGQKENGFHRRNLMDSYPVAKAGIDALLSGQSSHVPGRKNRVMLFLSRFMSREFLCKFSLRGMSAGQNPSA